MRRRNIITTAIVGGAVAAALVLTPSLTAFAHDDAKQDSGQGTRTSQAHEGMRHGAGNGKGDGMPSGKGPGAVAEKGHQNGQATGHDKGQAKGHDKGQAKGHDKGSGLSDVPSGTLTAEQKAVLTEMAEEEKLAYDLYTAFADKYDDKVFSHVARAEARHQEAVRTLLERYDVTDPTVGLEAGAFPTESTQKLYDSLLAQGSANVESAREAARTVEKTDIADLTEAAEGVTAPDVKKVYERLLAGSERHLVAFGG